LLHPTTGLETDKKPRKIKGETVTDCFTGEDQLAALFQSVFSMWVEISFVIPSGKQLVAFLVEKSLVASDVEALLVGNLLLEHKHIVPVANTQTEFKGKKADLWRFKVLIFLTSTVSRFISSHSTILCDTI
jgi:hypothetical protein